MSPFKNVLIIDDDPILRAISQSYFAALNVAEVYVAGNGRQALTVISDHSGNIDFILCDLNMPELDGVELLRHLRDCSFSGSIGIVSGEDLSVIDTASTLAQTYKLNIAGTVQKPLNKQAFDDLVASAQQRLEVKTSKQHFEVNYDALKQAIGNDEIVPFYQPKIAVQTGDICGVEALARWIHPDHGLIPPDRFIACAEQSDLIGPLTSAMIEQTIQDVAAWKARDIMVHASINVTPEVLESRSIPDKLEKQVLDAGLQPERFTIEITERSVLQKSALAMEVVARLRLKGFDISIDDFGTGAANIDQLRNFPYSELKIDRSFVEGATVDRFARACLKASATFARELDMRLVAEGVSCEAEWNLVAAEAVDEVQGFMIAKPMPREEFEKWYLDNNGSVDLLELLSEPQEEAADEHEEAEEEPVSLDELLKQFAT